MKSYTVFFWTAELSPHLLPLFSSLLKHPRIESALYIAQSEFGSVRRNLGWEVDRHDELQVIIGPDPAKIVDIVASSPDDSVHVFVGIRWYPCIVQGLAAVIEHRRRFGILHEPRVLEGAKGIARLLQSWATEGAIRRHADFVLAIGAHGPAWFTLAGYARRKIFPFAYFLANRYRDAPCTTGAPSAPPVIAFLGRLEHHKGIDLFLDSLQYLEHVVRVRIAGSGSRADAVAGMKKRHATLEFLGPIQMSTVPQFLAETDILVLPSITKDDGWGAVVSEALMAGAAVIATYRVGASMCLADPVRGAVVPDLRSRALARAVNAVIDNNILDEASRRARAEWAVAHLDASAGSAYFLAILDSIYAGAPRPNSFVA